MDDWETYIQDRGGRDVRWNDASTQQQTKHFELPVVAHEVWHGNFPNSTERMNALPPADFNPSAPPFSPELSSSEVDERKRQENR